MARSLESMRVIPHEVDTPEHLHSKGEQQAEQEVEAKVDR